MALGLYNTGVNTMSQGGSKRVQENVYRETSHYERHAMVMSKRGATWAYRQWIQC